MFHTQESLRAKITEKNKNAIKKSAASRLSRGLKSNKPGK